MEELLMTETFIIELLLIVALVAVAVRRLRVPYTVALVLAGLVITFQQTLTFDLTPELIMALFVPPLVFEAAFHIQLRRLQENLIPILVLAVPGVLLTTVIVGGIVAWGVRLPITTGLIFGALISATDPVAVVSLFRVLGTPKRLAVIVEGESLFNDGTAIVVFNLILALALPTTAETSVVSTNFSPFVVAVFNFFRVAFLGLGAGIGLGWLVSKLIARIDDYLVETTLTTVLAFGAYLVAERLHVSGVLAVVGAGLVNGNIGPRNMSPTTRIVLFNFWEYLAFIVNSLIFLLIGLDINLPQLFTHAGPIAIAVLAVLISRAIVVYGLSWLGRLRRRKVPWNYEHVLFWGGLRGAICLALALSLPASLPERELLRVMAFGVVLFTLLVQGTTMSPLLRRLGLLRSTEAQLDYERCHGQLMATRAALDRLRQIYHSGVISATTWEQLAPRLEAQLQDCLNTQRELLHTYPDLQEAELRDAEREGLKAQRAMLSTLFSDGLISEQIYEELLNSVDLALDSEAIGSEEPPLPASEE